MYMYNSIQNDKTTNNDLQKLRRKLKIEQNEPH
jgi:hypothetical protein